MVQKWVVSMVQPSDFQQIFFGKFRDFISEKGCLKGTSENFEKNKVQREKWPVPSNGPPPVKYMKNSFLWKVLFSKMDGYNL